MAVKLQSIAVVFTLLSAAGGLAVARPAETSPRAPQEMRLPGALVLAKRPTISEILDIILADRKPGGSTVVVSSPASGQHEESEESRIAAVLGTRTADSERANRIAAALVREGKRANISSTLLVGVLLTENPDLEPRARSSVGARGLMQVMPVHAGQWGCPSGDLFDIESNICHGVRILADDLRHARDLPAALLRYNGCVRGTNTPDCYLYAGKVYRHARQSASGRDGVITPSTPFAFLDQPRARLRQRVPSRKGVIVLPRELLVD
jgi:soluble lytic murein transglycosylase-like protein